jgi:hypothetical protein
VSAPEEVSRDELAVVVARQAAQLEARDRQITEMAGRLAELIEVDEALAAHGDGRRRRVPARARPRSTPRASAAANGSAKATVPR